MEYRMTKTQRKTQGAAGRALFTPGARVEDEEVEEHMFEGTAAEITFVLTEALLKPQAITVNNYVAGIEKAKADEPEVGGEFT